MGHYASQNEANGTRRVPATFLILIREWLPGEYDFPGLVVSPAQTLTANSSGVKTWGIRGKFRVVSKHEKLENFLPALTRAAYYT
jgi:hypothetical protein